MIIQVVYSPTVKIIALHHGGTGYFCRGCSMTDNDAFLGPQLQDCIGHCEAHISRGDEIPEHQLEALRDELRLANLANQEMAKSRYGSP